MKNILLIIISILGFHLAISQEVPTYTSINIVQYPADVRLHDLEADTFLVKPTQRFSFQTQRIPFALREEFETFNPKLDVFKEKIGNDSITVEIRYERFDSLKHEIDYKNHLMDGEKYFIHHGYDANSNAEKRYYMRHFLKSILVKSNGDTLVFIPTVTPYLFSSSVGSKLEDDTGVTVEKLMNNDFFHVDITGGGSLGSYRAFLLFNTKGIIHSYVDEIDNFRAIGEDFFSTTGQSQYLIRHQAVFNAFELGYQTMGWEYLTNYGTVTVKKATGKKNVGQCKTINLSSIIRTDSLEFGEAGKLEGKPFFIYLHEVKKDKKDPFLYHVKGLDKLDKNIHHFEGEMRIKYVTLAGLNQTNITGEFVLRENSVQKPSGEFIGAFRIMVSGKGADLSKQIANHSCGVETFYNGSFKSYGSNTFKLFSCGNDLPSWINPELKQWWKGIK